MKNLCDTYSKNRVLATCTFSSAGPVSVWTCSNYNDIDQLRSDLASVRGELDVARKLLQRIVEEWDRVKSSTWIPNGLCSAIDAAREVKP